MVDIGAVYRRMEAINRAIGHIRAGREVDVESLNGGGVAWKKGEVVRQVHINKVMTEISAQICEIEAERVKGGEQQ